MPLIDITALANQCRVRPQTIYDILEQIRDAFELSETLCLQRNVPLVRTMPEISELDVTNTDDYRSMKGLIFASASTFIQVGVPVVVTGHSLFRDGLDLGSFGLWGGEPGWNAVFAASDDRVLPPICHAVTIAPNTTAEFVHTIDINTAFTTGTATSKQAESSTLVFLGGL